MRILTRVNTGEKSEYLFRMSHGAAAIYVELVKRGGDDRDAEPYAEYDGKGRTAIIRLAESHEHLWQLFLATRALANFDTHGRFCGFKELSDICDDSDLTEIWERAAELFEATADYEGLEA